MAEENCCLRQHVLLHRREGVHTEVVAKLDELASARCVGLDGAEAELALHHDLEQVLQQLLRIVAGS